ncbi:hypothetical protein HDU90_006736 [Geranomyces variabilis]|nr:hypothetical protein HDU90_006736 [Geranomyces variabilis]
MTVASDTPSSLEIHGWARGTSAVERRFRRRRQHAYILGVCAVVALITAGTLIYRESLKKTLDRSDMLLGDVYFIGDSVTRYQYMELVYYLETGFVSSTSNHRTLIDGLHDPTNEHTYESWTEFYRSTTDFAQGRLTCDCHRIEKSPLEEIIENRVYTNGKVKLVYAQYFKDIGVCSVRGRTQGLRHPHPSSTPDWCYKLPAYVESLLKGGDANDITVVLNSGLHGSSVATEELEVMSDMFQKTTSGTKADRSKTNLLIWKTTTPTQNGPPSPNVTFPANGRALVTPGSSMRRG